jgi:hypothetical protein
VPLKAVTRHVLGSTTACPARASFRRRLAALTPGEGGDALRAAAAGVVAARLPAAA